MKPDKRLIEEHDAKNTLVYKTGNTWQLNRYAYMSEFNRNSGIKDFGTAKGGTTPYFHLLTKKDSLSNFLNEPEILNAVNKRFSDHKAGDLDRVLTNTVASQTCCFNLFVPLQKNKPAASLVFSNLLQKSIQVDDIIIEFTPEKEESLGDQSEKAGTDSDVAVFYSDKNIKGVILIEFKYIENGFSRCTTYKNNLNKIDEKNSIRDICRNPGFFEKLSTQKKCGYMKYNNWQLTRNSQAFDYNKIVTNPGCPFKFSLQQLWRNMLLAENVKNVRKLDEFHFWVISPAENENLWKEARKDVFSEFQNILSVNGKKAFRRIHLGEFFEMIKKETDDIWFNRCLEKFRSRYLIIK